MMFRRNRGRIGHIWPLLRPWVKSPLEMNSRRDLQRANRLMEVGDFLNAANLYENLARKLHDSARPRQAAHLYVQAARAKVLAGKGDAGLESFEQGLSIFVQEDLWEAFDRVGSRAIDELRQNNQAQAADSLVHWMDHLQKSHPSSSPAGKPVIASRRALPLKCPSCGATIRPDEVAWVDDIHAECAYCGSMLAVE